MNKIQEVLLKEQLKTTELNWFQASYFYMIDRNLKTKKEISKWLNFSLIDGTFNKELVNQSKKLRGKDQLYCMIGNVSAGGHFWLTFWSTEHDKLVVIDATYYPSMTKVINRPKFILTEAKYKKIWYIFNETTTLKVN